MDYIDYAKDIIDYINSKSENYILSGLLGIRFGYGINVTSDVIEFVSSEFIPSHLLDIESILIDYCNERESTGESYELRKIARNIVYSHFHVVINSSIVLKIHISVINADIFGDKETKINGCMTYPPSEMLHYMLYWLPPSIPKNTVSYYYSVIKLATNYWHSEIRESTKELVTNFYKSECGPDIIKDILAEANDIDSIGPEELSDTMIEFTGVTGLS